MKFIRWLLFIAINYFIIQNVLADDTWQSNVSQAQMTFERATGRPLRDGHRIEATVFPDYYAVRSGNVGGPAAYFRNDMMWTANIKSTGWSTMPLSESSAESQAHWLKEQVEHLPLDKLILVKRDKPPVAVIWSAPDCPFCRRLESALERENVSVYVAPVGLSEEGYRLSAELYCAQDPAKAWTATMQGGQVNNTPRPGCVYQRDMLGDIGFFIGRGHPVTPIVAFADGTTITGWDDEHALVRLREKIAQNIFFPSPKTLDIK